MLLLDVGCFGSFRLQLLRSTCRGDSIWPPWGLHEGFPCIVVGLGKKRIVPGWRLGWVRGERGGVGWDFSAWCKRGKCGSCKRAGPSEPSRGREPWN